MFMRFLLSKEWVIPTLSHYSAGAKRRYELPVSNKSQIVQNVEQILIPILEQTDLELVDVEFVKEGGRWYLRIFIDKPAGINHEDCRFVSESIDELLDGIMPVTHSYTLEVSSPGIERSLKKVADFERFTGHNVAISTFAPIDGKRKFEGCLKSVRPDEGILIEAYDKEIFVTFDQIASARLAIIL